MLNPDRYFRIFPTLSLQQWLFKQKSVNFSFALSISALFPSPWRRFWNEIFIFGNCFLNNSSVLESNVRLLMLQYAPSKLEFNKKTLFFALNKLLTNWWFYRNPSLKFFSPSYFHSEKADLKPRHDSHIGVPHLDSIYTTTTTGFHHPHLHGNGIHQGSPEAMKVRMAAMVLSPPTRV
jgi:hypothetical protein